MYMHKFGNPEWLKLSRIVLNKSDYFISSEFITIISWDTCQPQRKCEILYKLQIWDEALKRLAYQCERNSNQ